MAPRRAFVLLTICLAVLAAAPAQAASPEDEAAIRATALDYIEGWYEGDADRMARALHPELAKRVVITLPDGRNVLDQMSAMTLVENTGARAESPTPADQRRADVTILDVYQNAASVKVDATGWVDYLHLAKWRGEWKIVNVLYELRPGAE